MSLPLNTIELRVERRPAEPPGEREDYSVTTIVVDGRDIAEWVPGSRMIGQDPDDMLIPTSPLLPAAAPRRVSVYRCGCCGDSAEDSITPLISAVDGLVVWSDERHWNCVLARPLPVWVGYCPTEGPVVEQCPHEGKVVGLPDFVFDGHRYAGEVARATADLSWETADRTAARLLARGQPGS